MLSQIFIFDLEISNSLKSGCSFCMDDFEIEMSLIWLYLYSQIEFNLKLSHFAAADE